jgi:hypothetical protein
MQLLETNHSAYLPAYSDSTFVLFINLIGSIRNSSVSQSPQCLSYTFFPSIQVKLSPSYDEMNYDPTGIQSHLSINLCTEENGTKVALKRHAKRLACA